ncbi:MAG: N-acetylglucosamine-6-phosphate deacetylase [Lachnospiraceae bacterium]
MIIQNGLVFTKEYTFEPLTIHTEQDMITEISNGLVVSDTPDDGVVFDATGCYVLPGLTDIHFHGCDGYDFCDGTPEAFDAIGTFALAHGVTSICPATMTLPADRLSDICENAARYHLAQKEGTTRKATSDLIGIHMEGPFINAQKKGAQNDAHIIEARSALLYNWQEKAGGLIKLVSLAPEISGSISCIEQCQKDFHFSLAHTEADYETAMTAFRAGADHVTHLYNAMPPFSHRAPGVIGAAFDTQGCFVELICDGIHIAPSVVRATFRLFGEDRVVLVSDSMEAAGKPDGDYSLGGLDVHVSGNMATLPDGTLAGSVTPLYQCMRTAVSMGIPLSAAIRASTINPCRSIGTDAQYGSIEAGKKAHFLLLKKEDLSIKAIIKGQLCI